jgi:hypothetical protein
MEWGAEYGSLRLKPLNLTTLPRFSVFSAMSGVNSEGEPASGSPPISANFARVAGSRRALDLGVGSHSLMFRGYFFFASAYG